MEHFFKKLQVQNVISDFRKLISDTNPETSFDKDRNEYISLILGDMARNSEEWDQKSQINIGYISERFYNELKAREPSKGSLDEVFSTCFRFLLEYYLNSSGELIHPFSSAKSFAIHQLENFTDPAKIQLEYALREMPITILKGILNGEDFTTVRELPSIKKHTEELKEKWDQELDLRLERLKKLKASLEEYEHAFNFAGLFKGFLDLGETKKAEYNSSKKLVKYLSIAMPLPIVIETVYFMLRGVNFNTPWDLIKITPAASITLLIIYFFKIALKNHTSIKAQLLQIEIRKTLCQFIQSYVTYSKDLKSKEHNPLDKFEDIIFSNIMTAEEKIPSTFDGIDQLANMVQAFKGTKG